MGFAEDFGHSFLYISETWNQNFRSIRPKKTLRRAQNKNQWPSAADWPNLVVLKLSRAEPLQPYFWAKSFKILDLGSLGDMETLGFLPFCSKKFLKIGKHPNIHINETPLSITYKLIYFTIVWMEILKTLYMIQT